MLVCICKEAKQLHPSDLLRVAASERDAWLGFVCVRFILWSLGSSLVVIFSYCLVLFCVSESNPSISYYISYHNTWFFTFQPPLKTYFINRLKNPKFGPLDVGVIGADVPKTYRLHPLMHRYNSLYWICIRWVISHYYIKTHRCWF